MGLNSNLEKNFSWLAFPGLIRAIVMLQCVVFALITMKPETASFFKVTPEGIANGEYWRLIAWIFHPFVSPTNGHLIFVNVIFLIIVMKIAGLFSDSLENAWGEVRTSFYIYGTLFCQTLVLFTAACLGIPTFGMESNLFYLALFFAFATLFPDHEFLLFLILPVKVWILAALSAIMLVLAGIGNPFILLVYAFSFLPYLIWAIPRLKNFRKNRSQVAARRVKYQSQVKGAGSNALHHCHVCQRTEQSDPNLEFRVAANGEEYCLDHLDDEGKAPAS
jgi:hypothetical protein